ncbi:MAG TPA: ATP-dependent zinc metalloprotease FtsH [Armatimonadota bacterium]|nr:ATP-dependent zinc metalloprotease FtsH [Armatimonadota bacterium]HOS42785.1 ATP-dependent zinc metalloprotease FtsH [Armatimonadota bacterium]
MAKYSRYIIFVVLLGLAISWWISANQANRAQTLKTSVFVTRLEAGEIATVEIQGTQLSGELRKADGKATHYRTFWVADQRTLMEELHAARDALAAKPPRPGEQPLTFTYDVKQSRFSDGVLANIIPTVLMLVLFIGFWIFIMRQAQAGGGQAMAFGRSRAKRIAGNTARVTFDDVAGVDEAKLELAEIVDFLKNPKKYSTLGARIPKGVLLLGPPGSGKTLLARAVAGEAGVPFFHISGSDFVEMFVGVGASRVRDLFEQAKAHKPCIIFIDEIDAVGRQRFAGFGGGHDEREQTLNQLLVEMDGFEANSGVILIAATNRPDVLDPALLRPGRFDRRVTVDHADLNGRKAILGVHARGKPIADDVSLDVLARRTPGFSGADLANMLNEAALIAARYGKMRIEMADLENAIDRVIAGPERKSRLISEKEKGIIAYHEVGHALLAELLEHADPLHKVSILPRGQALGYTLSLPVEDKYLTTRSELMDNITVMLGGRAAEDFFYGEVTTGAHNDLQRATAIARAMVMEYGMSDTLGPRVLGKRQSQVFLGRDIMEDRDYSEETAERIDAEVQRIIEECYTRAKETIRKHGVPVQTIVGQLLEKETLSSEEVQAILYGGQQPEPLPISA